MAERSTHLQSQDRGEKLRNGDAVLAIIDTEGFAALEESIRLREKQIVDLMASRSVHDAAEYAKSLGEINGIRQLRDLAEGVIEAGVREKQKANAEEAIAR